MSILKKETKINKNPNLLLDRGKLVHDGRMSEGATLAFDLSEVTILITSLITYRRTFWTAALGWEDDSAPGHFCNAPTVTQSCAKQSEDKFLSEFTRSLF